MNSVKKSDIIIFMRLSSFQIQGFKSIIDTGQCKVSDIDNVLILAGQNEAGKTAVLEALSFFANGPSQEFEKYQKRQGSAFTSVVCTFALEDKDKNYLVGHFKENNEFGNFLLSREYIVFERRYQASVTSEINVSESFFVEFPSVIQNIEQVKQQAEEIKKGIKTSENLDKTGSIPPVVDEKKTQEIKEKVKKLLIGIVPAISLYSSFKDLLPSEIEVEKLQENNAVKDFQKVFSVDLKKVAKISDPRDRQQAEENLEKMATDDFNESWNQTISSIRDDKKYRFLIKVDTSSPKKIIFMIKGQDDLPLYLEQKSQGFRWFSAFHLRLKALKLALTIEEQIKTDQYKKSIVILIDEPGQNLHDRAQQDVKKILDETATSGIQVIYSTHNPNLIGTNGVEFSRIRLISNDDKLGTKVDNIAQFLTKEGSRDALAPIRTAMGLNSVYSIFDTENRLNVVVEGITDHYYLKAFQILFKLDERFFFLPACGVDNAKSVASVLIGWGTNYRVVIDDDASQGRKVYNDIKKAFFDGDDQNTQEYIYKLKDHSGIEDIFTQHEFSTLILKKDLTNDEKKISNSEIAKNIGKKEMYGRLFLDKAMNDSTSIKLSKGTRIKILDLFTWLYKSFSITAGLPKITD